jgi:hypothetical protein
VQITHALRPYLWWVSSGLGSDVPGGVLNSGVPLNLKWQRVGFPGIFPEFRLSQLTLHPLRIWGQ